MREDGIPDPVKWDGAWLRWDCPEEGCEWRYCATQQSLAYRHVKAFKKHWLRDHGQLRLPWEQLSLF